MDYATGEELERLISIADEQSRRCGLGKTPDEARMTEEISTSHHGDGERLPLPEEFAAISGSAEGMVSILLEACWGHTCPDARQHGGILRFIGHRWQTQTTVAQ